MLRSPRALRLAIALFFLLAVSPGARALIHTGGVTTGTIAGVDVYDTTNPASPVLTDQTETLSPTGAFTLVHDSLLVATGLPVRRYASRDISGPALGTWAAGSQVLALADGPQRGLVLVLDSSQLSLVRFPDAGAPVLVWSMPIDESAAGSNPGRIVLRDGGRAYVADASIPGIRVILVDPLQAPVTLATYASPDGVIHDMSLWGGRLTLATDAGVTVVGVTGADQPTLSRLGFLPTSQPPSRVDANSRYALVGNGQDVTVVDVDPASAGFLSGTLDQWHAASSVDAVRLDKADRAYVLLPGGYEILGVGSFGGR